MRSLRSRLLVLLSVAVVALSLVQSAIVFFSALHEADELFDHHLQQLAYSLRDGRFDAVTEGLQKQPSDEEEFEFVIRVRSATGERLHESGREHPPLPDLPPDGFSTFGPAGAPWRLFTTRTDDGRVDVAQAVSLRRELALEFALGSIAPTVLVVPLLLLAVGWAVGRAIRPLETLAKELERRSAQRLDPFETAQVLPEMLPVVRSINGLLARVRASFAVQRAFVADAAHELRSPLTALKLQSQLLARARDETERATAQARLEAGVDRSIRLAEQLLALAREEEAEDPATAEPHDMVQALRLALEDVATQAQVRSVELRLLSQDSAGEARASPEAMRLLARNLLENAIRHAPAGGEVSATVSRVAGEVELTVDDNGPGIARDERERVFDRFYRAADASPGGSGLGLAIVKAIADRCQGRVWLEASPRGGLRACVRLPAVGP